VAPGLPGGSKAASPGPGARARSSDQFRARRWRIERALQRLDHIVVGLAYRGIGGVQYCLGAGDVGSRGRYFLLLGGDGGGGFGLDLLKVLLLGGKSSLRGVVCGAQLVRIGRGGLLGSDGVQLVLLGH